MSTKIQTVIKAGAVAVTLLLVTGCAGLQSQIDALDARVDDLAQAQSASAASSATVGELRRMAASAQATADEALAAAILGIECCEATNEKIDRMFERSQSK
jgi:uncharacterized membrane protein YqiK